MSARQRKLPFGRGPGLRAPDFLGFFVGVVFLWASLTPSLLPRVWYLQGVLSGLVAAIGYGVGATGSWVVRKAIRRRPGPRARKIAWIVLGVGAGASTVYQLWESAAWQQEMRGLLGLAADDSSLVAVTVGALAVAGVVALLVVLLAGLLLVGLRGLYRYFSHLKVLRRVPRLLAGLLAASLSALVVLGVLNGLIPETFTGATNEVFGVANAGYPEGYAKPDSPLLSGSDDSLVSWESLGSYGRTFVAGWPTVQDLAAFHDGADVLQPIRVYVGLETSSDLQQQVRLAMRELHRTNAFEREVLLVGVPTGSGSVNPRATRSLEYLTRGDVATVTVQYSYTPSWASFLIDRDSAARAGRALIDAVAAEWAALDEASRPRLLVYGESLGSYGVESALGDLDGLAAKTDGVFLAGPPGFNPLREALIQNRDPGSPEYLPGHHDDPRVAFAATTQDLMLDPLAPAPELVYLQYPTDPVVKWDADLLFSNPEWFEEQKRDGFMADQTEWHPIVTFFQVSFDMLLSIDVPDGVGHRYGADSVRAWLLLTGQTDLGEGKIAELEALIAAGRP